MRPDLGYTFQDCALIIGCLTVAVLSVVALMTVLCTRRQKKQTPHSRAVDRLLQEMATADARRGRLNPLRLLTRP